ncbi:MAG: lytic transglycosylase domain-containing protein [Bryobacteraceae bacterium]|nr:lytic transglycosylase domain-containing protein [Bryobacteraceae bacterium]
MMVMTGMAITGNRAFAAGTASGPSRMPYRVRSVVHAGANGRLIRAVVSMRKTSEPEPVELSEGKAAEAVLSIPELVETTAKKYDVDPLLVHSVIQVESGYNSRAVSPKGAQGMMQLMPGTARRFGVSNIFDPRENVEGGVRYLKYLQSLFPQDTKLAIAAYNAGEGAVWKYNNRVPPYRETEQYVQMVGQRYGRAKRDADRRKTAEPVGIAASPEPAGSAGPVYASVSYTYDANGQLLLTTGNPESKTP